MSKAKTPYFMVPDIAIYIRVQGRPSILMDDACGITYEASNQKIPLYGYRDKQFAAVTSGRELVSGMLMVNKNYKDSIAAVLLYSLGAPEVLEEGLSREEQALLEDTYGANSANHRSGLVFLSALQKVLGRGSSRLIGPLWSVPTLRVVLTSLQQENTLYLSNTQAYLDSEQGGNEYDSSVRIVNYLREDFSNAINEISDRIDILENTDSTPADQDLKDNYNNLASIANDIEYRIEENKTNSNIINNGINEKAVKPPESPVTIEKYKKSLVGSSFFDDMYNNGHKIDIEIEFGADGKHRKVLRDCYFNTEATSVHVGDRENIKEAYSFFAKTIV